MELRSASPLNRKGRGSHPILGPGLKQREGQREKVGPGLRPGQQFCIRFNLFVNNHLLDPDFFIGGR